MNGDKLSDHKTCDTLAGAIPDGRFSQRTQFLFDEVRVDTVIFQVLEKPGIAKKRELLLIFLDAANITTCGRYLLKLTKRNSVTRLLFLFMPTFKDFY